jgi:hypothetical protein
VSDAGVRSNRFLNAVYPIPIPTLFSRLAESDGGTVDLQLSFRDRGPFLQGGATAVRVTRY